MVVCDSCGVRCVNGSKFCSSCGAKLVASPNSTSICAKCSKVITGAFVIALASNFHRECLTCESCGTSLISVPFVGHGGKPYCQRDYQKLFAPQCGKCKEPIEKKVLDVDGVKYHPKCFTCNFCHKTLVSEFVQLGAAYLHANCAKNFRGKEATIQSSSSPTRGSPMSSPQNRSKSPIDNATERNNDSQRMKPVSSSSQTNNDSTSEFKSMSERFKKRHEEESRVSTVNPQNSPTTRPNPSPYQRNNSEAQGNKTLRFTAVVPFSKTSGPEGITRAPTQKIMKPNVQLRPPTSRLTQTSSALLTDENNKSMDDGHNNTRRPTVTKMKQERALTMVIPESEKLRLEGKPWGRLISISNPQEIYELIKLEYVLGAHSACDISLDDDGLISLKHCTISSKDGVVSIEDSSTNGTYINGIRVNKEELKLQNKDEISLVVPNDTVAQEMGMKRQAFRFEDLRPSSSIPSTTEAISLTESPKRKQGRCTIL